MEKMRSRIRHILQEATAFEDRPNINDNFWKWFGDSKIVDTQGNPLVVFHGTWKKFSEFDISKIAKSSGNRGFIGKGFYFSTSEWTASAYGDLMEVYLRITNPFNMSSPLTEQQAEILGKVSETHAFDEGNTPREVYNMLSYSVPDDPSIPELISDGLMDYGYDGIILKDSDYGLDEIVVFHSTQIKSIFNQGTWNPNDKDIMK